MTPLALLLLLLISAVDATPVVAAQPPIPAKLVVKGKQVPETQYFSATNQDDCLKQLKRNLVPVGVMIGTGCHATDVSVAAKFLYTGPTDLKGIRVNYDIKGIIETSAAVDKIDASPDIRTAFFAGCDAVFSDVKRTNYACKKFANAQNSTILFV